MRRALLEKLAALPEWKQFQEDFAVATGLEVLLVDALGGGTDTRRARSRLCELLAGSEEGRQFCQRFHQEILHRAENKPTVAVCDAGLQEVAWPVQISGVHVGYLFFGGVRGSEPTTTQLARVRHLLQRAGVHLPPEELREALRDCREISPRLLQAYLSWVALVVGQMAAKLSSPTAITQESLPLPVEKAAKLVRAQAVRGEISLPTLARACGVSAGHLSRLFHRSTGLTLTEFTGRVRVEHARQLLHQRNQSITEIAFASGFNSLSQFHRVYRRVYGQSPRESRRAVAAVAG
jgi:AraC-like DNA-binding protein